MPHITLARLRQPDMTKLMAWLTHNALFSSPEFAIESFHLYSSQLSPDGSRYRIEQSYFLEGSDGEIDD
jgi:2'-5' RNA ligase